ncbi:hypothetical protein PINS_up021870 [Pythium insidiosum]|nr:hypothetical protein PINS_up021870 [Pythium insidiosum]
MNRISNSKKPFVAAIDGSCLGGGLRSRARVPLSHCLAEQEDEARSAGGPSLAFCRALVAPSVFRVSSVLRTSLDMMLTGKNIKPEKAKKMGLVDQVADPFALEGAWPFRPLSSSRRGLAGSRRRSSRRNLVGRILEDNPRFAGRLPEGW